MLKHNFKGENGGGVKIRCFLLLYKHNIPFFKAIEDQEKLFLNFRRIGKGSVYHKFRNFAQAAIDHWKRFEKWSWGSKDMKRHGIRTTRWKGNTFNDWRSGVWSSFEYLIKKDTLLFRHQRESGNCWFPWEEPTVESDRNYYRGHSWMPHELRRNMLLMMSKFRAEITSLRGLR